MMTQCPECGSVDIMAPLKLAISDGGHSFVEIAEPQSGTFHIRAKESAELRMAICGACGYAEQYIENFSQMWKYWQKGYR